MADRTLKNLSSLAAGGTDNTDSPAIPAGKVVRLVELIAGDINTGPAGVADHKSSGYVVQFGIVGTFTEIAFAAMTGNTIRLELKDELVGDGAKFVRVVRQNNSGVAKRCPFILRAYDK